MPDEIAAQYQQITEETAEKQLDSDEKENKSSHILDKVSDEEKKTTVVKHKGMFTLEATQC